MAVSIARALCHSSSSPSPLIAPSSAYVHLPFCRKRCFYCDFPVVALGSATDTDVTTRSANTMQSYADLLCTEIRSTAKAFAGQKPALQTLFFGGGTPSLTPPPLLAHIIETLRKHFVVDVDAEISIEMDPGTFDAAKLREYVELGVTRVSVGVQAFQDELLRACGRAHGAAEVREAVQVLQASGLRNWSMDLISSLPHQTLKDWCDTLREAIRCRPAHVSVYDLQIEPGTKFGAWYSPGQAPLPADDVSADFFRFASRELRAAGFQHYEISNYALPGFQCRHNLVYWKNLPYFGFGLGATSFIGGARVSRPRRMREYVDFVKKLENNCEILWKDGDARSVNESDRRERALDTVMLSLRLSRGLDLASFAQEFGLGMCVALCLALKHFVRSGHVVALDEQASAVCVERFEDLCRNAQAQAQAQAQTWPLVCIRLSDPEGFLFSNEVISTAFAAISAELNSTA